MHCYGYLITAILLSLCCQHILEREEHWNTWKNESCPSYIKDKGKDQVKAKSKSVKIFVFVYIFIFPYKLQTLYFMYNILFKLKITLIMMFDNHLRIDCV